MPGWGKDGDLSEAGGEEGGMAVTVIECVADHGGYRW
jgi:hypothetical protein